MADLLLMIDSLVESENETTDLFLGHVAERSISRGLFQAILPLLISKRRQKARVENFVESVLPLYNHDDFRQRYRMNRSTFDKLVCHLSPKLLVGNKGGKMKVSVEKQLLIYIKYASSQQTLTEISDTYGVGEGTAHCIIHRTSSLICADMLSNLITWPSGLKVQENVEKFYQHKSLPGIIGAIGGSHIPIRTPKLDAEQYFNRKKFPSIVLQAVCDYNLHFLDVFC